MKLRGSGSHSAAAAVNTLARLAAVQEGQVPRARQAIDYERALPPRLAVQPEPRTAPAFETDVVHRPPDVDSPRSTRPRSLLSDQLQIGTAGYATPLERRSSRPALRLPSSPTSPTSRPAVSPACRSPKNRPIRSRTHTTCTSPACRPSPRDPLQWHAPPPNRLLRRAALRRSPRRCRRRPEEEVGAAAATARPLSRGRPHAWESSPATET